MGTQRIPTFGALSFPFERFSATHAAILVPSEGAALPCDFSPEAAS
jgi:hypothetical protein